MSTELQPYLAYLPHDDSFETALLEELKMALPDGGALMPISGTMLAW